MDDAAETKVDVDVTEVDLPGMQAVDAEADVGDPEAEVGDPETEVDDVDAQGCIWYPNNYHYNSL